MKTATQYTEEVLALRKAAIKAHQDKVQSFLDLMELLKPVQAGSALHVIREGVREGKYKILDIMCDKCGVQLVASEYTESIPLTRDAICCECGAHYVIP